MTTFTVQSTIASESVAGEGEQLTAYAAHTGAPLDPPYRASTPSQLETALAAAQAAFDPCREAGPVRRAELLDRIADGVDALGDALVERAVAETGLPAARIAGERGRTTAQLRLFAAVLREGGWSGARIDPARRLPLARPDVRRRLVPVGPVAVFGASNFPLAFSTAGGDTASALAAGCPVVVKAHQGHPGTAALVGGAVGRAVVASGMPGGVFSQVFGSGRDIGQRLVADHRIAAVGFTGSRAGGLALVRTAQARPVPIPVYAEMSSVNPVVLLPAATAGDPDGIARGYVESLTLGSGQFCTNPGVLAVPRGAAGDRLLAVVAEEVSVRVGQTMLGAGILRAYVDGVASRRAAPGVSVLSEGRADAETNAPAPIVFVADADAYSGQLTEEIFGAAGLVLRYDGERPGPELRRLVEGMEGQLTATVWAGPEDRTLAAGLLPVLERKAGRILFNGWPTGVEVTHAMVHGGPFPATSDARSTSVGTAAIERFLRPVAYQDLPEELLPPEVRAGNPLGVPQRVDGLVVLPSGYAS